MNIIDGFLNRITMYRLVFYGLLVVLLFAEILSSFNLLGFGPVNLFVSVSLITVICVAANYVFSRFFHAPTNFESTYITAFILALIVTPAQNVNDLYFLVWVGVLAIASKYILAYRKKHVFNPAAISLVLTGFILNRPADWWVGTRYLLPVVAIVGFLIVRKTRKEKMVITFLLVSYLTALVLTAGKGSAILPIFQTMTLSSALIFFATVMFTEPLTLPPTNNGQLALAVLVGIINVPQFHAGSIYISPEIALAVGNVLAFFISPKDKLILKIGERIKTARDTADFVFPIEDKLSFRAGQYMEWTLPHKNMDSRGNRRYFTIASSPTENNIRLGIKFYAPSSSYKKALLEQDGLTIVGAAQAGDFTLPNDRYRKLAFFAGGIGITPFRSMIKYLIDSDERRDIVIFYSNKSQDEILYKDIFNSAYRKFRIRTVYTLTDKGAIPQGWKGEQGRIDAEMIKKHILDYNDRLFYLSGPRGMVTGFETVLKQMGVKQIKTDFFPGFV